MCSTANSVPRIAAGIARLCRLLGTAFATLDGEPYYTFPPAARLA